MNNYPIKPIKALVKSSQILNSQHIKCTFLECEIIGLSLYKDEACTCIIKLEDGECFRYIPLHSLYWKRSIDNLDLTDLLAHNNLSDDVKISYIETLNGNSSCYINGTWHACEYVMSVDYYTEGRMLNLLKLDNGMFAMLPFNKIKFKPINEIEFNFKKYKKQTEKYSV